MKWSHLMILITTWFALPNQNTWLQCPSKISSSPLTPFLTPPLSLYIPKSISIEHSAQTPYLPSAHPSPATEMPWTLLPSFLASFPSTLFPVCVLASTILFNPIASLLPATAVGWLFTTPSSQSRMNLALAQVQQEFLLFKDPAGFIKPVLIPYLLSRDTPSRRSLAPL